MRPLFAVAIRVNAEVNASFIGPPKFHDDDAYEQGGYKVGVG